MADNSQINVLILDDEASIRESLADFLEDFDFNVSSAETAEEALDAISESPFEIAIVDMRLPGMDGNAFIVKANEINEKLKFIVHTGSVNYHLTPAVRKIGVKSEYVFLKPVANMMNFVETINTLLSKKSTS